MPELPEVETFRRDLLARLKGARIERVERSSLRLRADPAPGTNWRALLVGTRLDDVERRGKFLILLLDSGDRLLLHLGMSGRLRFATTESELTQLSHRHCTLYTSKGVLCFIDARRFGMLGWWPRQECSHAFLDKLAAEPWALSATQLHALSRGRSRALRDFLCDQRLIAGVGNIYANEAAFEARLHPCRPVDTIGRVRWFSLLEALCAVLERAIEAGGSSLRDYRRLDDKSGYFSVEWKVYGRNNEPCQRCQRARVRRLLFHGRSVFWCPRCQVLPRASVRLAVAKAAERAPS